MPVAMDESGIDSPPSERACRPNSRLPNRLETIEPVFMVFLCAELFAVHFYQRLAYLNTARKDAEPIAVTGVGAIT